MQETQRKVRTRTLTTISPSSSSSATVGTSGRTSDRGNLIHPCSAFCLGDAFSFGTGLPLATLALWTEVLLLRRREGRPMPSPAAMPALAFAAFARTAAAGRQKAWAWAFSLLLLRRTSDILGSA